MWCFRLICRSVGGIGLGLAQVITYDTLLPPGVGALRLPEQSWLIRVLLVHPPREVRYDTTGHRLLWEPAPDSMRLMYRLFHLPPPQMAPYQPQPLQALMQWDSTQAATYGVSAYAGPVVAADTFTSRLRRSGSLTRSLTIGTGQNATLNSAFRLSLEGPIAPDLYLIAALTDENLPFQTATQTFSDFDRVFIGLRWQKAQLLLGDLEFKETQTRFANFYRNVLGIEARLDTTFYRGRLALAEAKGRFHTNSFMGQEGRQGPYLLTGKNNERFITILAGSEKVYINGQLMQRGVDRDYVIDYTTGEITFTPQVPITAATRIVVDFEYADRSYGRTFVWTRHEFGGARWQMGLSYFRQADNPRRPLDFTLTPEEEARLAQLPQGSTVGLLKGVDTLPYEPGTIRYKVQDTLIGGVPYTYFVVSQDPAQALYQVSFAYVGPGRGDYVRASATLNGNVFSWVGPGKGDFIVGRAVPLPTATEIFSLRPTWEILPRLRWIGEANLSRYQENRFAAYTQNGLATHQKLTWQAFPDSAPFQISPELAFQYVAATYQNVDRVYEREYGRLWNYNDQQRADERLWEARLPLNWKNRYRLTPSAGQRRWGDTLLTQRYAAHWEGLDTTRGLAGTYLLEYLHSAYATFTDRWIRHTGRIFWAFSKMQLGTEIWTENRYRPTPDTLTFRFYDYTPFWAWQPTSRFSLRVAYNFRREWQALPLSEDRTAHPRFYAHMPRLALNYHGERLSFSTQSSYRIFSPLDTVFRLLPSRTLLSQNTLRLRQTSYETELFYQVSAELTPQRQLIYIATNPGQGTHEWRDFNGDGLQQLEEFVPAANPLLANYLPFVRATGRFFPTVSLSTTYTFRWQPVKRLAWLSTLTNLRLEQRQTAPDNRWVRYLPVFSPKADTTLPQWSFAGRQDVFLFRQSTRGDQNFAFQYTLSQQVPLSGLTQNRQRQVSSRTRYNFSRSWGGELVLTLLERLSIASAQPDLNYRYTSWEAQPHLIYQPTGRWRTSLSLIYRRSLLYTPIPGRGSSYRFTLEQRYSWKAAAFVSLRIEPALYQVPEGLTPVLRFEVLEGLQEGRNLLIGLTLNLPLSRYIELNTLYDGRFSAKSPVHSARMQVRANF